MSERRLIDIFFKDFFDTGAMFEPLDDIHYPVNIRDLGENLKIEIAAIGAEKEDINIQVEDGDVLRVKYEKPVEKDRDDIHCKTYINKIAKRSFNFGWKIPIRFDIERIEVTLKNGLLEIIIPIEPKAKPKKIEILKG